MALSRVAPFVRGSVADVAWHYEQLRFAVHKCTVMARCIGVCYIILHVVLVVCRDAMAGRHTGLLSCNSGQQAAGASAIAGPLSIIKASSAAVGSNTNNSASSSVHQATDGSAVPAVSNSSSTGTADNPLGSLQLQQWQPGSTQSQQEQLKPLEPNQPQQQQQQQRMYHPQQQHYSLQGRVVQLERQLKYLSRVTFKCGNWLDMGCAANKFGVVTCFSITKWIHLNWGDDGIMKLFHKLYR